VRGSRRRHHACRGLPSQQGHAAPPAALNLRKQS
jgi:hypothetical protein